MARTIFVRELTSIGRRTHPSRNVAQASPTDPCSPRLSHGLALCYNSRQRQESMVKRTYQPKRRRRKRTHGFLSRMRRPEGRNILRRRRAKKRSRLTV